MIHDYFFLCLDHLRLDQQVLVQQGTAFLSIFRLYHRKVIKYLFVHIYHRILQVLISLNADRWARRN